MSQVILTLASVGVGVSACLFRVLTVGGGLSNDHYAYLAWAQQLLAGGLPGRDFVDAGMPLAYSLSALAQLVRPGPFSEVVLTAGMLGIAAGVTCLVVGRMTGSILAGIVAAAVETALMPRFYSFPKILVPVVALALLQWYAAAPSRIRLGALSVWTILGGLLRYDLGLYTGIAMTGALLVVHWREWSRAAGAVGGYIGMGVLAGLPYAALVQWSEGIQTHLHGTAEYTKSETHALAFGWPGFPGVQEGGIAAWNHLDSATLLFYLSYGLVVIPLVLLIAHRRVLSRHTVAAVIAAAALVGLYLVLILRHPLEQRIQDLASVLAVTGTWSATMALRSAREWLAATGGAPVAGALMAAVFAVVSAGATTSIWVLGKLGEQLRETRIFDGPEKVRARIAALAEEGGVWPWKDFWPNGALPEAVEYLHTCTRPTDRLLLTWSAPEFYYFSGRPFAAGHALVLAPRAFTTAEDQSRMLAFLARYRVPIVLINETRRDEFAGAYPALDAYLAAHYIGEGRFTIYDGSEITIARHRDIAPAGTWGGHKWPCGL